MRSSRLKGNHISLYFCWLLLSLLSVNLTFAQSNPTFTSIPSAAITYGENYSYLITVTDPDADATEVVIQSGVLPPGLSFADNFDGTYSITGVPTAAGSFPLIIEVRETLDNSNNNTQAVTIQINKASLNINAIAKTIVFGEPLPTLTLNYTLTDFVNGETALVIDAIPTLSTNALADSDAGTYNITLSGGSDNNYELILNDAFLTISQATQTISFTDPADVTYGAPNINLAATATSGLPVTFSIVSGPATLSGNTVSITGAGTVLIEANQPGNINFSAAAPVQQSFVVSKANLNVTADSKTIVFGDALPALTFTYNTTDFVNGETVANIDVAPSISTTASNTSNAGIYPITLSGGSDNNYNLLFTNATVTITKANQTISFTDPADVTYGAPNFDLVASATSGLPVTFSVVSGPATLSGNTVSITGAGTVLIQANQPGNINFSAAAPVQQSFAVSKANLSVTADSKTIVFGDALPALTFTYNTTDFANGETVANIDVAPSISTTASNTSNAGIYPISLSNGSDNNYNFIFSNATLTITKANQTIAFTDPTDVTYGAPNFDLVASATSGLPVTFSVVSGPATLSGNTVSITGAGTVLIQANQPGNINFSAAAPVQQSFVVSKANLNVTADSKTIVFGDALPPLTFTYNTTDFVNGETVANIDVAPSIGTTASNTSNAGIYPISLSGGSDNNYNLLFTNATLTITKANQTIAFTDPADITYGAPNFDLVASATSGLPVTFSIVSGPATLSGNTVSITGAGTVLIQANQPGNVNFSAAAPVQQSFVVSKANLNVTADSKTIVFGDALPALTFTYNTTDFVNGETVANIDVAPSISTTASNTSNAGIYPITLSGGSDNNYNLLFTNATLTITKANQTIAFTDPADVTFGAPNFNLVATSTSGLPVTFSVVSGPATLSGNTVSITGAGTVLIQANQPGNVNFSAAAPVQQSFVVSKANLNVTADSKTIVFGDALPALTFTYNTGDFVNGETVANIDVAPSISTTASNTSNAGIYPITLSGGSDNNYNFIFSNATLTITKTNQTIAFTDPADVTFGAPNFDLVATATSGLPVTFSVVSGPATLSGNTVSITGAGTVLIQANQPGNVNFSAAAPVQQSFVVSKASTTINFLTLLKNFDGTPKQAEFTTIPAALNTIVTYDGNTNPPTNQGTYTVLVTVNEANYQGSKSANFVINGAPDVSTIPTFNFNEDQTNIPNISLTNYFSDVEDPTSSLSFTLLSNSNTALFSNLSLTGSNIAVELIPEASGTAEITVRCTDSNGLFTETSFTIVVASIEDQPFFTSTPITSVNEDSFYSYIITAADNDAGDVLTISNALVLPNWLNLTDNGDGTALLSGTPGNNNVGVSGVAFTVSDQKGNTAQQLFNITVNNTNDAPAFTSTPITTASVGVLYSYTISATDIDANDMLTFTVVKKPSWLSASQVTTNELKLSGTPTTNDRVESSEVLVRVTDIAGAEAIQQFTIVINFPNTAPTFQSSPVTAVNEDEAYTYNLVIDDIDNDVLTVEALLLPAWLNITELNGDFTVEGIPTNNEVGSHQVILSVTDQLGASNTQSYTIVVKNINDAPIFNVTPLLTATQNKVYNLPLSVIDVDAGDQVTFSFLTQPDWLTISSGNVLTGTPTIEQVNNSPYSVSIEATDQSGASDILSFSIEVVYENSPPTIDPLPALISLTEDDLALKTIALTGISAGSENDQIITISTENSNPELFEIFEVSYNSPETTGTLSYQLAANAFGEALITIKVEDNGADDINAVEESFQITVAPVNDKPFFVSTPVVRAQTNSQYTYSIEVDDADKADVLTITKVSGPDWLTLTNQNARSATLSGDVPASLTTAAVTLKVTDQNGIETDQSFVIDINNKPAVTDYELELDEDENFIITQELLTSLFIDADDDNLTGLILKFNSGQDSC